MNNTCPDCKVGLNRDYGLPGVVSTCPKCNTHWVKCLDRLISLEELHQRAEAEQ